MLELRPGDRAVVTGLGAALEGQVCVVGKYREKRSGFKCVLEKGGTKCFVNPRNLRLESWVLRQREKVAARCIQGWWKRKKQKSARTGGSGAAAQCASGGAGFGGSRGGGGKRADVGVVASLSSQSGKRPDGGANDVGLGPATNGVVGSPFAHVELIEAARAGDVKRVNQLLKRGAKVDEPDAEGRTPLCYAAWKGHVKMVKVLLENKADVEKAKDNGCTPLFDAAEMGHTHAIELLLEYNADVNKGNKNSCTPLSIASEGPH